MSTSGSVEYDEFGLFHENAAEFGLPFDVPPTVRREGIEVAPDRRLSALVWGEGPPEIVLLHGGAQNAHTWDTVALALRPRPLVVVDLPGHGHSDGPEERADRRGRGPSGPPAERSPQAAAQDVAVVIRALAPEARGVVGMSFGGLTAIALTAVAPDLVRRLLLVDVLPGLKAEHGRHIVDFVHGPPTFASFDDILERTIAFNPTRAVASLRRGILHNAEQLEDGSWVWRHSRWRLHGGDGPTPEPPAPGARLHTDLIETLGAIEVPVLLARGMRPDSVLREDDEAAFVEVLPSAQVVHFHEAGHSIQGDMPVELAATIGEFIP